MVEVTDNVRAVSLGVFYMFHGQSNYANQCITNETTLTSPKPVNKHYALFHKAAIAMLI